MHGLRQVDLADVAPVSERTLAAAAVRSREARAAKGGVRGTWTSRGESRPVKNGVRVT